MTRPRSGRCPPSLRRSPLVTASPVAERADGTAYGPRPIRARRRRDRVSGDLENGKPITQSRGEVDGCAGMFEYAAGAARALHRRYVQQSRRQHVRSRHARADRCGRADHALEFPVPHPRASGCRSFSPQAARSSPSRSEVTSATTLLLAEVLAEGRVAGRRLQRCHLGAGRSAGA